MPEEKTKSRIHYSPEFWCDVEGIMDYIEEQSKSSELAIKEGTRILDRTEILKEFPLIGQVVDLLLPEIEVRLLVEEPYIIIYKEEPGDVFVLRAFHQRQNYVEKMIES